VSVPASYGFYRSILLFLATLLLAACDTGGDIDTGTGTALTSPLGPRHLAIIVNDSDPLSRRIAEYYSIKRQIPYRNIIHVNFKPGDSVMRPAEFRELKAQVDSKTPRDVQAYALAWTAPYRVGCMSITTAFAAGFDAGFCAAGCKPTKDNPYFDSDSRRPFDDFGWRPAIMLAGNNFQDVSALIDRGVASDYANPPGSAYLVSTSDRHRNSRARYYRGIRMMQSERFRITLLEQDVLKFRPDIMFYFTGLATVPALASNSYLPGAIADHLTSAGGKLTDSRQMSSLRWLQAGATGSYGAVAEPCNFVEKFPHPGIVIERYLNGETLLEAYWKSVEWPGQGVFIGEPLARPFAG
jgi:uncharacterized protein (TIGR03790 family)